MTTVLQTIHELLPSGSRRSGDWDRFPTWPPDVFAVAASLVERSGCYTYLVSGERGGIAGVTLKEEIEPLQDLAENWASNRDFRTDLQRLWTQLLEEGKDAPIDQVDNSTSWCVAAHKLLIVADHACAGIGFRPEEDEMEENWIQAYHLRRNIAPTDSVDVAPVQLTHPPTACMRVPASVACVQPKTHTPGVGCTVRSLSHHLALLPPRSVVHVAWHPRDRRVREPDVFNLLAIPLPYAVM